MESEYRAKARHPLSTSPFRNLSGRSKEAMSEVRKRTIVRPVRFTPDEWAAVQTAALAAGMNAARYLRSRALGTRARDRKSDEAIRQLIAVGNNLNQLARSANIAGRLADAEQVEEVLAEVLAAVRQLG